MTNYGELTTVYNARALYLGSEKTTEDVLLLRMVRQATSEIESVCSRHFSPRIETRRFPVPRLYTDDLIITGDLLEVSQLTNGDGGAIAADQYDVLDLNRYPKHKIALYTSQVQWQQDSTKLDRSTVGVTGVWGYHEDYPSAWAVTGAALDSSLNDSATSIAGLTTGLILAGDLVQIDDEILYVQRVTTVEGSPDTDTLTVARGANGSTAAAHDDGANIKRWEQAYKLTELCARAAVAHYRLRSNPTNETITLDGVTFVTPKDVVAHLVKECRAMGLVREAMA